MYCDRCWEDRSIVHTCTPCREYMLDIIQKEILAGVIVRYRYDDDKDGNVFEFIMIWDVIAYIEETWLYLDEYYNDALDEIIRKRKQKRKPLSDQSDECIRYIYSLLPSEVRK